MCRGRSYDRPCGSLIHGGMFNIGGTDSEVYQMKRLDDNTFILTETELQLIYWMITDALEYNRDFAETA